MYVYIFIYMMYIHVVPLKTGEACKTKDKKVFGGEGEGRGWGEGGERRKIKL